MRRVHPKVFLVGETGLNEEGATAYLEHIGTSWRPDPEISGGETLAEMYGRLCYRSWEAGMNANVTKVREGNDVYLGNIVKSKHGAVLEHATSNWILADVSRVFTHELVRHRVGVAYSQESLRYVRLTDLGLWLPPEIDADPELRELFETTFETLEQLQLQLAEKMGLDEPGTAFSVKKQMTSTMRRAAPIGLATTIGVTLNFRTMRHLMELRTSPHAEVEARLVIGMIASIARRRWPNAFADYIKQEDGSWTTENVKV